MQDWEREKQTQKENEYVWMNTFYFVFKRVDEWERNIHGEGERRKKEENTLHEIDMSRRMRETNRPRERKVERECLFPLCCCC